MKTIICKELLDEILSLYISKHEEELKNCKITKEDLEKPGQDILNNFESELESDYGSIEKYYERLKDRIYKTKSRWVLQEINNEQDVGLNKEISFANLIYNDVVGQKIDFKEMYKVENPEELRNEIIKELKEWRRDNNAALITFKYLPDKKKYQAITAAKNDLEKLVIEVVTEKWHENSKEVYSMPKIMGNTIVSAKQEKIDITNPIEKEIDGVTGKYYQHLYVVDEKTQYQTLIGEESVIENAMSQVLLNTISSVLDIFDIEVFLYVLSRKDANFYSHKEVVLPLSDIVKHMTPGDSSPGKFYYQKVRGSLLKMANIRVSIIGENSLGANMGIFNLVKITQKDKDAPIMVRVEVSTPIVDDLLKRRTINIYKDSLQDLKNSTAKVLAFKLQAKRISFLMEENENKELKVPLAFFKSACMLSSNREDRNAKQIAKGLSELMKNKIIIDSYRQERYDFYIKFREFTDKEKEDLISQNDNLRDYKKDINEALTFTR